MTDNFIYDTQTFIYHSQLYLHQKRFTFICVIVWKKLDNC